MPASAMMRPNGSLTNEWPKNSRPSRARLRLESDAVRRGDVHAVGDGVAALDRAPGVDLRRAELGFLRRMPADRRRIEQDLRAEERRNARGLGIPLVPADEHADASRSASARPGSRRRPDRAVLVLRRIARREVVFLVEERVVGDVHLAIHAEQRAVGVDHGRRVAVEYLPPGARTSAR